MEPLGDCIEFRHPKDLICKFWAVGGCAKGEHCRYRHTWSNGDGFSELAKQEQQRQRLKVIHWELLPKNLVPKKSKVVKSVVWNPPPLAWIKANTDGAARGSTGEASCGGVFRNFTGEIIGFFYERLGNKSAIEAEIYGVINAINFAWSKGWRRVWLECDSEPTVRLVNNKWSEVPDSVKDDWLVALERLSTMEYKCTHIYREGNKIADILAHYVLDGKYYDPSSLPGVIKLIEEEAKLDANGHIHQRVKG